jgi:(E)-4-hydroxy-3-methyl-but-2-enyl pyrophosphate reductase
MKIVMAKHTGFCFGVRRAITKVNSLLNDKSFLNYSIGPPIHNPQTVNRLVEKGLRIVDRIEDIRDGRFIIRAHGLAPELVNKARARNIEIMDTTCPFVKKVQEISSLLAEKGYTVVIVGDKEHPEVKSIEAFTGNKAVVVEKASDLNKLNLDSKKKVGLLAQTTQSNDNFRMIVNKLMLKNQFEELRIFNTICEATVTRQEEAKSVAREVEMVIVLGGKLSANTKRLAKICRDIGVETHHVEIARDIKPSWLRKKQIVGLVTGTSTPAWVVKEVANRLKRFV